MILKMILNKLYIYIIFLFTFFQYIRFFKIFKIIGYIRNKSRKMKFSKSFKKSNM